MNVVDPGRLSSGDLAAVGGDDGLHQRQPQADAAGGPGARGVAAGEPLEDPLRERGVDARPVVVDDQLGSLRPRPRARAAR